MRCSSSRTAWKATCWRRIRRCRNSACSTHRGIEPVGHRRRRGARGALQAGKLSEVPCSPAAPSGWSARCAGWKPRATAVSCTTRLPGTFAASSACAPAMQEGVAAADGPARAKRIWGRARAAVRAPAARLSDAQVDAWLLAAHEADGVIKGPGVSRLAQGCLGGAAATGASGVPRDRVGAIDLEAARGGRAVIRTSFDTDFRRFEHRMCSVPLGQPDLAGTFRIWRIRVPARGMTRRSKRSVAGRSTQQRVAVPFGGPDDVALVHVDGIDLGMLARRAPGAPARAVALRGRASTDCRSSTRPQMRPWLSDHAPRAPARGGRLDHDPCSRGRSARCRAGQRAPPHPPRRGTDSARAPRPGEALTETLPPSVLTPHGPRSRFGGEPRSPAPSRAAVLRLA